MANLVHTFPTVFHITRIEPNAPQADSENRTNGSRFKGHINISATFEDCARDKALVFVDITETLQRFILSDAKYFAVFRPAGSGKSFMLSMFRYFFEHRALPPPPKFKGFFVNERRDDRQERLLEMNVAITKWPEWKSHLGTFHVLFFDFVTLSSTEPLLDFQEQLTSHLTKILWANPALGTATSEQERKNMHHILRILEQPLALDDLGRLVQWVVRILFDCTGIMTLVLIDHIEAPLVASLQDRINGPVRPCSDTTVRLLHQVIPAFSSSPHVHGLIAVGVYPFVFRQEHGIVTDCLNTTNSVFATACGFFENEVEELWKNRGESISQNELRNSIPGAKSSNRTRTRIPLNILKSQTLTTKVYASGPVLRQLYHPRDVLASLVEQRIVHNTSRDSNTLISLTQLNFHRWFSKQDRVRFSDRLLRVTQGKSLKRFHPIGFNDVSLLPLCGSEHTSSWLPTDFESYIWILLYHSGWLKLTGDRHSQDHYEWWYATGTNSGFSTGALAFKRPPLPPSELSSHASPKNVPVDGQCLERASVALAHVLIKHGRGPQPPAPIGSERAAARNLRSQAVAARPPPCALGHSINYPVQPQYQPLPHNVHPQHALASSSTPLPPAPVQPKDPARMRHPPRFTTTRAYNGQHLTRPPPPNQPGCQAAQNHRTAFARRQPHPHRFGVPNVETTFASKRVTNAPHAVMGPPYLGIPTQGSAWQSRRNLVGQNVICSSLSRV